MAFAPGPRFGFRRLVRADSGSALVEVALIVSLFGVPLLIGSAVLGQVTYVSIEVTNAAHAGAMYGMQSAVFAANTSGITSAAQAEASDLGTNLTVTPTTFYVCSAAVTGTKYTGASAQANATAGCTGGTNHPLEFVQVNTSATVTPNIRMVGLPTSFALTGVSVMGVEQ
jgi:Flp pilus assembly protein TadG